VAQPSRSALVEGGKPVAPLSFAQERLWFIDATSPGSATYNVPLLLRWTGPVDVAALSAALSAVVRRHEVLRTTYRLVDGAPVQVIGEPGEVPVLTVDGTADTAVREDALRHARLPFDLAGEPPLRCVVWRGVPGGDVVLLCVHHIAVDGWSSAPLLSDLHHAYHEALAGREPSLAELPFQYADFAAWDRDSFDSPEMAARLTARAEELLATSADLELFGRREPTRVEGDRRGDRYVFDVPPELWRRTGELAAEFRATPFVLLLAAFQVVLARWSERDEFPIGAIMANRPESATEELVGFFVNTVPLRCRVDPRASFRQLCKEVRAEAFGALTHQRIPFDQLTAAVRERGGGALANVTFALQNMPAPDYLDSPKWTAPEILPTATAKSDLQMWFEQGADGLRGIVEYDVDCYPAETARTVGENVAVLLAAAVADPDLPVADLPISRAPGGVLSGPRLDRDATTILDVLAERFAAMDPAACAVSCGTEEVSWGELDRWAWAVADRVRDRAVRYLPVVASRGGAMVAAWLGVLRAGAAYVPLAMDTPPQRMGYILSETGATTVLADAAGAELLARFGGDVEVLRIDELRTAQAPAHPVAIEADAPCVVLYTSGTTGRPKGAVLRHRGLLNTALWWAEQLELTQADRVLCPWSSQFDPATFDVFRCLATGARLLLADDVERRDPKALLGYLRGPGAATVTSMTPALVRATLDADEAGEPLNLRAITIGGEAMTQRLVVDCVRRWGVRVQNIYGPTEISLYGTSAWIDVDDERPTIGLPVPNTRVYILGRHGEELPPGVPGELYLAGAGVGLGYLAQPERTAAAFRPDPFGTEPGAVMYASGDRARVREDGQLDFLGRFDDQVKIMGNRIESTEVATLLEEQPSVRAAAVFPEGSPPRLVAFVVLSDVDCVPTRDELVKPLLGWLPPPVLPAEVYVVDALPRNGSDKVDLHALREMRSKSLPHTTSEVVEASGPALTADERRAVDLLVEVLAGIGSDIRPADLRPESNFFTLGGHSLLAVRLIAEAERRWGVAVQLRDFLVDATVAGLAKLLASAPSTSDRSTEVATPQRYLASSVQQRLWFLDRVRALRPSYLVHTVVEFTGPVDVTRLCLATSQVLARHPALRSRFELDRERREIYYRTDGPPPPVELVSSADRPVEEIVDELCWTPFDLAADAPARAGIVADGDRTLLVLVAHHMVFDGWSREVLFRELTTAYTSTVDDLSAAPHPGELAGPLGTRPDEMIARLRGAPTDVELPGRRPRPAVQECDGAEQVTTFGAGLTARLRAVTGELGCSMFVTTATLVGAMLARTGTQRDFLFAFPWAGRDSAGSADAVGMFVNTPVLRVDLRDNPTWRDALVRVREESKACYRDADVPFEDLVAALHPDRDLSRPPLTPVYIGAFEGRSAVPDLGPGIGARLLSQEKLKVMYELDLTVTDLDDELELSAIYATGLLDATTVAELLAGVVAAAEDLTADPAGTVLQGG
jgi:amino acid adenylation domain-containing protein